jgi:hypothetical protein
MKYDDAGWHVAGDFPKDLPPEAGATHIGMFAAWCMLNGLAGELHVVELEDDLQRLRLRQVTPGAWFIAACDSKFVDEDLNDEGNDFAGSYYNDAEPNYLSDLTRAVGDRLPSPYHLPDTWDIYDQLAPMLKFRFDAWKRQAG